MQSLKKQNTFSFISLNFCGICPSLAPAAKNHNPPPEKNPKHMALTVNVLSWLNKYVRDINVKTHLSLVLKTSMSQVPMPEKRLRCSTYIMFLPFSLQLLFSTSPPHTAEQPSQSTNHLLRHVGAFEQRELILSCQTTLNAENWSLALRHKRMPPLLTSKKPPIVNKSN